jgi:hypothetical protein
MDSEVRDAQLWLSCDEEEVVEEPEEEEEEEVVVEPEPEEEEEETIDLATQIAIETKVALC